MNLSLRAARGLSILVLMACILVFAVSCKKSSAPSSGPAATSGAAITTAGGSGSAKITYRPEVRIMEEQEGQDAIIGVGTSGAALLFAGSNSTAQSFKAGDVLVIKGLIARTVLAAENVPEGIIVLTQQAELGEIVQQGKIHVEAPVRFSALRSQTIYPTSVPLRQSLGALLPERVYAQSTEQLRQNQAEAKGNSDAADKLKDGIVSAVTKDWEVTWSATPAAGRLNLNLTLKKDVGGFIGLVKAEGHLDDFDFASDIDVDQGVTQRVEAGMKKINGSMNVNWSVAKDSAGGLTERAKMKLPGAITIPLGQFLGGLPLFLEISAAVIVNPAITGGKEYSRGSFRVNYDGYQHFTVKEGTVDSDGNVSGDIKVFEQQGISATAPMGMVVAFAAPRIELSLGLKKLFKMTDIKEAAGKVDMIADQVAKRLLTSEQQNQLNKGPLGKFSFANAADVALGSDATAYFEFTTTSGTSFSGMSAFNPCSRSDITLSANVGASAEAFKVSVGKTDKNIFKKQITHIEPPGVPLCESVGK
jgi:hypothetical protein